MDQPSGKKILKECTCVCMDTVDGFFLLENTHTLAHTHIHTHTRTHTLWSNVNDLLIHGFKSQGAETLQMDRIVTETERE